MKYSNKDYDTLRQFKEGVAKAKQDYINSLEVFILFQLSLCSRGITEKSLLTEHYLEFERLKILHRESLIARDRLQCAYVSLVAFQDYLKEEYSKNSYVA